MSTTHKQQFLIRWFFRHGKPSILQSFIGNEFKTQEKWFFVPLKGKTFAQTNKMMVFCHVIPEKKILKKFMDGEEC